MANWTAHFEGLWQAWRAQRQVECQAAWLGEVAR